MKRYVLVAAIGVCLAASAADAAVIAGPSLVAADSGWSVSGLSFTALHSTTLTSFVFQNQGQADTVVLTDTAGNILQSLATPAGVPSDHIAVSWALAGGQQYWLLQSATASNAKFVVYNGALVSDADIAMVNTGVFNLSINGAVNNTAHTPVNNFWFTFNDITTGTASSVPEPLTLALFGAGLLGMAARRRRKA